MAIIEVICYDCHKPNYLGTGTCRHCGEQLPCPQLHCMSKLNAKGECESAACMWQPDMEICPTCGASNPIGATCSCIHTATTIATPPTTSPKPPVAKLDIGQKIADWFENLISPYYQYRFTVDLLGIILLVLLSICVIFGAFRGDLYAWSLWGTGIVVYAYMVGYWRNWCGNPTFIVLGLCTVATLLHLTLWFMGYGPQTMIWTLLLSPALFAPTINRWLVEAEGGKDTDQEGKKYWQVINNRVLCKIPLLLLVVSIVCAVWQPTPAPTPRTFSNNSGQQVTADQLHKTSGFSTGNVICGKDECSDKEVSDFLTTIAMPDSSTTSGGYDSTDSRHYAAEFGIILAFKGVSAEDFDKLLGLDNLLDKKVVNNKEAVKLGFDAVKKFMGRCPSIDITDGAWMNPLSFTILSSQKPLWKADYNYDNYAC